MLDQTSVSRILVFALTLTGVTTAGWSEPFFNSQLVEPLNHKHNHGSCVLELPNGDVLMCWYKGSGERTADDVRIVGSRLSAGASEWSPVFEMADFEGFPDCNACTTIDAEGKLWMFWPLIVANQWETAILMSRYSTDYLKPGPPNWDWQKPILLKPGNIFEEDAVKAIDGFTKILPQAILDQFEEEIEMLRQRAGDKYFRRMGWMPRAAPTILPSGRFLLPLYSDGYSFSLVAISDDSGKTWTSSRPLLSLGGVQPSIVWKDDGALVAFMRDNGPPPKRIIVSESADNGVTWSLGRDHELIDSGAGVQALRLNNGHWLVLHNDIEEGRHSLALHLSDDEGETWKWVRHVELVEKDAGSFSYPSLHQGKDGKIHGSYSYKKKADGPGETIKYVCFNEEWIQAGD